MKSWPKEELLLAVDRLAAGTGASQRYGGLDIRVACTKLLEAVDELSVLRAETKEFICVACRTIIPRRGELAACERCRLPLVPHSVVLVDALRTKVKQLELRVELVESILEGAFELRDDHKNAEW